MLYIFLSSFRFLYNLKRFLCEIEDFSLSRNGFQSQKPRLYCNLFGIEDGFESEFKIQYFINDFMFGHFGSERLVLSFYSDNDSLV